MYTSMVARQWPGDHTVYMCAFPYPCPANYLHKLLTFIHGTIKRSTVCRYLQQNKAIFSIRWV